MGKVGEIVGYEWFGLTATDLAYLKHIQKYENDEFVIEDIEQD